MNQKEKKSFALSNEKKNIFPLDSLKKMEILIEYVYCL